MKGRHPADPRGLIEEAFNIEGITEADCRTIFFDWAVGSQGGGDLSSHVKQLHQLYAADYPAHPMTRVLAEGSQPMARPGGRRRQGRRR